jgi:AP2-associated kinase
MTQREVEVMRALPNHPSLVRFYESAVVTERGNKVVLILQEYCGNGTLHEIINRFKQRLSLKKILIIFHQLCQGVKALHDSSPSITHRDIKVENALLCNKRFKLCDFGSASTEIIDLSQADRA